MLKQLRGAGLGLRCIRWTASLRMAPLFTAPSQEGVPRAAWNMRASSVAPPLRARPSRPSAPAAGVLLATLVLRRPVEGGGEGAVRDSVTRRIVCSRSYGLRTAATLRDTSWPDQQAQHPNTVALQSNLHTSNCVLFTEQSHRVEATASTERRHMHVI
jgi:hypothetical protein